MKSYRKKILESFLILLAVVCVTFVPQISAEEGTPTITEEELTCQDLATKYGLYIEIDETTANNEYKIIKDPTISCGGKVHVDQKFKILDINGAPYTTEVILSKENNHFTFSAEMMHGQEIEYDNSGQEIAVLPTKYVYITLQNVDVLNETVKVQFTIYEEEKYNGDISVNNIHFNGVCKTLRDEAINVGPEGEAFFRKALPYCFKEQGVAVNYKEEELKAKVDNIIAIWQIQQLQNTVGGKDFNSLFSEVKNKAHNKGNIITNTADKITLKCPFDRVSTGLNAPTTYINEYGDSISSTEYYLNKDYYYSKAETTDGTIAYTYNYAPGNTVTETQDSCKRTCEESVKVEYGPPVASKAGLCFEYKVKVTSYVKCTSEVIAEPPKTHTSYCNPSPVCYSQSGKKRKEEQAGPSQEFERCINACDGGKYTEKCSLKCYEKAYGQDARKLSVDYQTYKAEKMALSTDYSLSQCLKDNENYFGCYFYESGQLKINWASNLNYNYDTEEATIKQAIAYQRRYALGRWYVDRVYKQKDGTYLDEWSEAANYVRGNGGFHIWGLSKKCSDKDVHDAFCTDSIYVSDENGFYRKNYKTRLCDDNCWWTVDSCSKNEYLNPGTIEKDALANQQIYDDAVAACLGSATCSEHTAEYTISLNYDTEDGEGKITTQTVKFPYSKKPDETTEKLFANQENNTPGKNSIILEYDGCYKNKNTGNHYMTEWSFPGTYIHNKTGEISFNPNDKSEGWYYEGKRFCMPLDAKSVNTKWWEWYKMAGENCYTTAEVEEELKGKTGTSNGYNIDAQAKNFGYFGWNFDVKCFYALKNEVCNIDNKGCCMIPTTPTPIPETKGVSNYTFRPVDTENLFPNAVEPGVIDDDKRQIGFNWTSKALSLKNSDYEINPTALISHIESNATSLYSDEATNLDYRFYLTPSTLSKIRAYNNTNKYASWDGTTEEINGINVYKSNIFRNVGTGTKILSDISGSIIKLGTPGVNNENYVKFGG